MTDNRTKIGLRAKNRGLIYEGQHSSFSDAVNDARNIQIDLNGIDMGGKDLRGINLDGIQLSNANFKGSNLTDANLSEAAFTNCDFSDTRLFEACFCYSDILHCSFEDSHFGLTDFSQAKIHGCIFSGPSAFLTDLSSAYSLQRNLYRHEDETFNMSKPPCVLHGFKHPIVFLDDTILIDGDVLAFDKQGLADIMDLLLHHMLSRFSSAS